MRAEGEEWGPETSVTDSCSRCHPRSWSSRARSAWRSFRHECILELHWDWNHCPKSLRPECVFSASQAFPQEGKATPRKTMPHLGNTQDLMQLTNLGLGGGGSHKSLFIGRVDSLWNAGKVSPGDILPLSSYHDTPWCMPVILLSGSIVAHQFQSVPSTLSPTLLIIKSDRIVYMACYLHNQSPPDLNATLKPSWINKHDYFFCFFPPCLSTPPCHVRLQVHTVTWTRQREDYVYFHFITLYCN